jgi:hypothetical protein
MNWIGRKRCSVKYAVNGWKGISYQIEGIFPRLILRYRCSDGCWLKGYLPYEVTLSGYSAFIQATVPVPSYCMC